jgi:hypothetical protein
LEINDYLVFVKLKFSIINREKKAELGIDCIILSTIKLEISDLSVWLRIKLIYDFSQQSSQSLAFTQDSQVEASVNTLPSIT